jgi:hypothetical protein
MYVHTDTRKCTYGKVSTAGALRPHQQQAVDRIDVDWYIVHTHCLISFDQETTKLIILTIPNKNKQLRNS